MKLTADRRRRMVSKRQLVGLTIVDFKPRAAKQRHRGVAHDPTIYLSDGSALVFTTEETDGDYGTCITKTKANPRAPWAIKQPKRKLG